MQLLLRGKAEISALGFFTTMAQTLLIIKTLPKE